MLAMEKPVAAGAVPLDPKSRFNEPEGFAVSFPVGCTCQRKSWVIAFEVELLNEEACKSSGFEL